MAARRRTGFDKFFAAQMRDPSFAKRYPRARAEVDAVDRIVRALDEARVALGMSKAELARLISAKPEIVRRLFTSKAANPTLATVVKVASALGYTLELATASRRQRASRSHAA
jgi:ribosome-binding protein aMBF1 (putative translation factor)